MVEETSWAGRNRGKRCMASSLVLRILRPHVDGVGLFVRLEIGTGN